MQVEGSTFLVTGGSSGLGGATVRMLAERARRSSLQTSTVRMARALWPNSASGCVSRSRT